MTTMYLTDAGAKLLAAAIGELRDQASTAATEIFGQPAEVGSIADQLGGDEVLLGRVRRQLSGAATGAIDCIDALSALLEKSSSWAGSPAALVRACIETLARGWYVMGASSTEELTALVNALLGDELRSAEKRGVEVVNTRGGVTYRVDSAEAASLDAIKFPGYSALAKVMLSAGGSVRPEAEYSILSGLAHGEVTSLASMHRQISPEAYTPSISRDAAILFTTSVVGTVEAYIERAIRYWRPEVPVADWRAACEACRGRLREVYVTGATLPGGEPALSGTSPVPPIESGP